MALERFWWGPSLDLLRDSRNGVLWLEHQENTFNDIVNKSFPKQRFDYPRFPPETF